MKEFGRADCRVKDWAVPRRAFFLKSVNFQVAHGAFSSTLPPFLSTVLPDVRVRCVSYSLASGVPPAMDTVTEISQVVNPHSAATLRHF